jgi:hypothetical protein
MNLKLQLSENLGTESLKQKDKVSTVKTLNSQTYHKSLAMSKNRGIDRKEAH